MLGMQKTPAVSICLPCLNTARFLPACLKSIVAQTLVDWELIICDGFSSDGSWEILNHFALHTPNCIAFQSRASLYDAWNQCIARASGEYIYIATSDDLVDPRALQLMSAALNDHPDCGICQISLCYIDEHGDLLDSTQQWATGRLSAYLPEFTTATQKRTAPHDGVLMAAFHTVYESINQLLVRREVFQRVGPFDSGFGSVGDYEWGMRVGLVENCLFLAGPSAYWRKHPDQVTQPAFTEAERLLALTMTRTAFRRAKTLKPSNLPFSLLHAMEDIIYDEFLHARSKCLNSRPQRLTAYCSEFLVRPFLLLRRLWRAATCSTTTTFDYRRKCDRIVAIMQQYSISPPGFL